MAERTGIAWTEPYLQRLDRVPEGQPRLRQLLCREARTCSDRWTQWGPDGQRVRTSENYWREPIRWNRRAEAAGTQERVFCASLADVFDNQAPPGARDDLWKLIRADSPPGLAAPHQEAAELGGDAAPRLAGGLRQRLAGSERGGPGGVRPPLAPAGRNPRGAPVHQLRAGAGSADPPGAQKPEPDWLIWGGESGKSPRPLEPGWIRSITRECMEAGIPVFGKQWGSYPANPLVTEAEIPIAEVRKMDAKKNGKGGALLDGQLWREFPKTA